MKTYSETWGKKPFDWNKFLQNPPEKGSEEHKLAIYLAGNWVTCAFGVQCSLIPRNPEGMPYDNISKMLGEKFNLKIRGCFWPEAKDVLGKIEKRSAEIIKGLTK